MKTPYEMCKIVKTEVTSTGLVVTLESGVTINISSNPNYLHLSFSGIKDHVVASAFAHNEHVKSLQLANYVDLAYTPNREP